VECRIQKFEKVYFGEFQLRNVPQIIPWAGGGFRMLHSAKFKSNQIDNFVEA